MIPLKLIFCSSSIANANIAFLKWKLKKPNKISLAPSSLKKSVRKKMRTKKFPKWVKMYNTNFKSLDITGAQGQPSVSISCYGGDLQEQTDFKVPPKFIPYADGTHCTVKVAQYNEDDNIDYSFDPKKAFCGSK